MRSLACIWSNLWWIPSCDTLLHVSSCNWHYSLGVVCGINEQVMQRSYHISYMFNSEVIRPLCQHSCINQTLAVWVLSKHKYTWSVGFNKISELPKLEWCGGGGTKLEMNIQLLYIYIAFFKNMLLSWNFSATEVTYAWNA